MGSKPPVCNRGFMTGIIPCCQSSRKLYPRWWWSAIRPIGLANPATPASAWSALPQIAPCDTQTQYGQTVHRSFLGFPGTVWPPFVRPCGYSRTNTRVRRRAVQYRGTRVKYPTAEAGGLQLGASCYNRPIDRCPRDIESGIVVSVPTVAAGLTDKGGLTLAVRFCTMSTLATGTRRVAWVY
jgi:hypothetical protein